MRDGEVPNLHKPRYHLARMMCCPQPLKFLTQPPCSTFPTTKPALPCSLASSRFRPCLQIFSDNVCPWCFVGKRHLESAMKQFAAEGSSAQSPPEFDVRWKPFFLNIKSPETSEVPIVVRNAELLL